MANDVKEEALEMKGMFEMKRGIPRRKNRDYERIIGTECGKKGCKIVCRWQPTAGK